MRTTIDIDPKLLETVVMATGEKSKSKAVARAMEEYVRFKAIEELRSLAGKVPMDENWDVWRKTKLGRLREFKID